MFKNFKILINSIFILLFFLVFTNCAKVATGAAVKVATVSQEERSIGELSLTAIPKSQSCEEKLDPCMTSNTPTF